MQVPNTFTENQFRNMKVLYLPIYLLLVLHLTHLAAHAQEPKDLKTVVITGSKPVIKQEADRIVYDLQADPDHKSSNLIEIMRKIPFLSVDVNENLLFRGQSDFRVFINGKPSSMMDRNLKEVLRSMPASTIQKIEVITNPSSKYDAEGLAGIINIVTVKAGFQGYNGNVNLSERLPVGGHTLGASFNYKQDRIGLSVYAGASQFNRPTTYSHTERISGLNGSNTLMQDNNLETRNPGGYLGAELSFEIDTLHLLSAQLNVNGSHTNEYRHQLSTLVEDNTLAQRYRTANTNKTISKGWDASMNYQIGFRRSKDRLLTFSYRYLKYGNELNNNVRFSERLAFETPDYLQENDGYMNEHTLQADYVQQVKQVSMEAGVKWINRNNESDFSSLASDGAVSNNFSNYFNYQQVWALYNSYQLKFMGWAFKMGMRLEATAVDASYNFMTDQVRQRYLNFIPNLAAGRKIGKNGNVNIGVAQRIKRPGINKLNPFVDRSNPAFEITGNPDLKPSLINNIMVGYGMNATLSVNMGLNYSWVKSLFVQASALNTETQITRTTYENTGKAQAVDADLNLRYAISKVWNTSVNLHGTYMLLEALNDGIPLKNNWFFYNISLSTGYNLVAGWRLTAGLDVRSRNMVNLQGTSNGYVASSFGVSRDMLKSKLSLSATVNNAFTKYRTNFVETIGSNFLQTASTQDYFRNFNLSLNYRFGRLKEGIKKSKRSINNDDLSN
jgi:ferric enterobactin receptor